eukprot:TRINITY_DN1036_c0_g1_i1.p2 TRINITY_DN1036_c0_g1~~TRINITY_DN1036_c0_g1_i1.p2  ORF type:complete len:450 (-),score=76.27 TRINITY_DN1036_c0_g1_i1:3890-5239(-)
MLHELKLAFSTKGDKSLLETDQRLREADRVLTELRRWFPQLQAAFEENEKIWASLAYNICTMAKTAQQVFSESHVMQTPLDQLSIAGQSVLKPAAGDALHDERARTVAELRAFNDCIRLLRETQMDCVSALKNKQYYASKLETIRSTETARRRKITDKEAERRLRNEQKLTDYSTQLSYQTEKLQKELQKALDKKQLLLEMVMNTYVRAQHFYFSLNPMKTVLPLLTKSVSPRALYELYGYTNTTRLASLTFPNDHSDDMEQPARAPSPILGDACTTNADSHLVRQSSVANAPGDEKIESAPHRKRSVRENDIVPGPSHVVQNIRSLPGTESIKNLLQSYRGVHRAKSLGIETSHGRRNITETESNKKSSGAEHENKEGTGTVLTASAVRTASVHNDRLQHLSSLGMVAVATRAKVDLQDTASIDVQMSTRTDSPHTENDPRLYPSPSH